MGIYGFDENPGIYVASMKLGSAFSDSLQIERKTSSRFLPNGPNAWWIGSGRPLLFATALCIAIFILVFRLFTLTIIDGYRFRGLADGNRTRELIRHAPRGLLLDRTGKPVAQNIAQYRLLSPCKEKSEGCTRHISAEEGEALAREGLPAGSFLEVEYARQYQYPEALAHALGYTGEITDLELADDYYAVRSYRAGDRVGRTGAEAVFEERLRGRDGRQLVEVDATGKTIRILGQDHEVPGESITISIDGALSDAVYKAFPAGQKGAVVVSNPQTGEILSLFSSPSYSLNDFSLGMSESSYTNLLENPDRPMFDRAIGGVYPPGSTFKIVTSIASLEEGAVTRDTTFEDVGVITLGPFSFPNWYFLQYGKKEGMMDIIHALKRSNDIFFYNAGERLGITKLAAWARKVGIGKPLGIELPGEATGLMPDPAWKNLNFVSEADRQARNHLWFTGDTYHVAIGQGYLLTTPLQVNAWTNVIANGGKLCKPTIEKGKSCKSLGIGEETIHLITKGMKEACSAGGTGWPLFEFKIQNSKFKMNGEATPAASFTSVPVACKTGTAEFGDPKNRTHAWFTVFAPLRPSDFGGQASDDNNITGPPEVSITVLVEGAGEGSDVAAPVAKKILEEWFGR